MWISIWIMQHHKNKPYLSMKRPIWFSQATATSPNSANSRHEAMLVEFFHFGRCLFSPQQWSCAQPSTDHENSNVLGRKIINWSNVLQFTQSLPSSKNNQLNGPLPTPNPNADRQFVCPLCCDQQCAAEAHKIYGHAFLLATLPRRAKSIPILLEARQPKLG